MRKILFSLFAFALVTHPAAAEPVQTDLFHCVSHVEGFQGFTIRQLADAADPKFKASYSVKLDWTFDDVWNQSGEARFAPNESPIFQSQFEKKHVPPADPLFPVPQPTWEDEVQFINVSISEKGTGSLSVEGGLEPILCKKLF